MVVGGFAVRACGYLRQTMAVDLLIATGQENEERVHKALRHLPDQAIEALRSGKVEELSVVRVADKYLVDLIKEGCQPAHIPGQTQTRQEPSCSQKPPGDALRHAFDLLRRSLRHQPPAVHSTART